MSGFSRLIASAVSHSLGRNRMTWRPGDGHRRVEGAGQLPEVVFDAPGRHPGVAKHLQQLRIEAVT